MADAYLGFNTSAAVNLSDGSVAYLDKGAKLPDNLADGELERLREAGTPLSDSKQSPAPFAPAPPTTAEEVDETPTLSPTGEPAPAPAVSVAAALEAATTEGKKAKPTRG